MNSFEHNNPQIRHKNPWTSIFYLVLLFIGWNLLSQMIGVGLAAAASGISIFNAETIYSVPFTSEKKTFLYVAQGISHFLGFTIFSLFFIKFVDRDNLSKYFSSKILSLTTMALVILITFSFMIFNSIVIEWNMNITFPDFMNDFATWAREMEDQLILVTKALSTYSGLSEMLVALVVVGVFPAVGEELVFRGLLQQKLQIVSKNPHAAIWVTAIIFGAFHLQFFGVFPRILLGALFGYIYYYSGNIWYPILAHFVNNGLAVVIMYIGPRYIEDWDPQEVDGSVPIYISIIALMACAILFRFFLKEFKEPKT